MTKIEFPRIKSATHYADISGNQCPLSVDHQRVLYKGRWRLVGSEEGLPGYHYVEIPGESVSFEIKQYPEPKEWQ